MTDWLDIDTPPTAPAASPPIRRKAALAESTRERLAAGVVAKYGPSGPSRKEIAVALRMLVPSQRFYLEELLGNGFRPEEARKSASIRLGREITKKAMRHWDFNPKFQAARRVLGMSLATALNPTENLLRLEHTIQAALTPRRRYVNGADTGEQEIDAGAALRGIELAGRINKQLGADTSITNRVTVQILDLTDAEAPEFAKKAAIEGSVEAAPTEEP